MPGSLVFRPLLIIALGLLIISSAAHARAERRYPAPLMNWMVEGKFHALIVDKSAQRLTVWEVDGGRPALVESYPCSTGENPGDKWVRGDMKTPEGVYFFCSVIDGRRLPPKYGYWAFTTDYPNFVDRRRGKSGDGIWLHGRDKPLGPKPDSNGCIALENDDLVGVSRFIRLQSTPLIVVKRLRMIPKSAIIEEERRVRDFIESWRQAWESQDLDRYMRHYSVNFQSCWLDHRSWREKKRRLIRRYAGIAVNLGNVYLYRQNGLITAIFTQAYRSDAFRATGIKLLYLKEEDEYRIYAEDYHQPVDDPYPVRVLLARAGVEPEPDRDAAPDFRIRLVSTDEPESRSSENVERPTPVAPSRGVELEKIAAIPDESAVAPEYEMNRKRIDQSAPVRMLVAKVMPDDVPGISPRPRPAPLEAPEPERETVDSSVHPSPTVETRKPARELASAIPSMPEKPVEPSGAPAEEFDEGPASERAAAKKTEEQREDSTESRVRDFLNKWKTAWEQKNLDRYIKMYHPAFQTGGMEFDDFRASKRRYFRKYQTIRVDLDRLEIRKVDGQLKVRFIQTFRGDDYRDKGWKTMVLADGKGQGLQIVREQWSRL